MTPGLDYRVSNDTFEKEIGKEERARFSKFRTESVDGELELHMWKEGPMEDIMG